MSTGALTRGGAAASPAASAGVGPSTTSGGRDSGRGAGAAAGFGVPRSTPGDERRRLDDSFGGDFDVDGDDDPFAPDAGWAKTGRVGVNPRHLDDESNASSGGNGKDDDCDGDDGEGEVPLSTREVFGQLQAWFAATGSDGDYGEGGRGLGGGDISDVVPPSPSGMGGAGGGSGGGAAQQGRLGAAGAPPWWGGHWGGHWGGGGTADAGAGGIAVVPSAVDDDERMLARFVDWIHQGSGGGGGGGGSGGGTWPLVGGPHGGPGGGGGRGARPRDGPDAGGGGGESGESGRDDEGGSEARSGSVGSRDVSNDGSVRGVGPQRFSWPCLCARAR